MPVFLILGAGPIGRATAKALLNRRHQITVGTRSGTQVPGTTSLTLDATDVDALTQAARGKEALIICTNPPYHRWPTEWPPVIESAIAAAKATGARIVLMGNLYAYGKPDGRITAESPINPTEAKGQTRAELWNRLLAAHQEHGISVAELRASDYFGPNAGPTTHLGSRFLDPIQEGKTARVIGNPDVPHSWSYLPDIGECLAILATHPELSNRAWIGPSSGDASFREVAQAIRPNAKVGALPNIFLRFAGLFTPIVREVFAIRYQFTDPFLLDDSELRNAFNFTPTPLKKALQETIAA